MNALTVPRTLLGAAMLMVTLAACGGGDVGETQAGATSSAAGAAGAGADTSAPTAATTAATSGTFIDPDAATREQLLTIPGMNATIADAIVAGRPHRSMTAVDRILARNNLTEQQRDSVYTRLWKPIDLNTASREEILLIPGVGQRMLGEFLEYRPYRSMERFRREIGKYVNQQEVARLERYVTIRDQGR